MHRSLAFSFTGKLGFIPAVLMLVVTPAVAEEREWINPAGGLFGDDSHWLDNAVPGTSDAAVFNLEADYSVFFDTNYTNDRLLVREGDVTFTTAPGDEPWGYELMNSNTGTIGADITPEVVSFMVGYEGGDNASLTLEGGTVSGVQGFIGAKDGSAGTVTIHSGGALNLSDDLSIGVQGVGSIVIEETGAVSTSTARIGGDTSGEGTATVTGPDATWTNSGRFFVAGQNNTSTLNIENEGTVSSGHAYVGARLTGSGAVSGEATISGPGSTWNNARFLFVGGGYYGLIDRDTTGTLTVEDGGTLNSGTYGHNGTAYIGASGADHGGTGTVYIRDQGSTWDNRGPIRVGSHGGDGTLRIENGGKVYSSTAYQHDAISSFNSGLNTIISHTPSAKGNVVVIGEGSEWIDHGPLTVGRASGLEGGDIEPAMLTIKNGGFVSNTFAYIGFVVYYSSHLTLPDSSVVVTDEGSKWHNSDWLAVGSGSLTINDGGQVHNTNGYIGMDPGAVSEVTVRGNGSAWTNTGTLHVGRRKTLFSLPPGFIQDPAIGKLTIADEGAVSSAGAHVGETAGGEGEVLVTGQGSVWTSTGNVYLGGDADSAKGKGLAAVNDGGKMIVDAGQSLTIWSTGTLTGDNGTIEAHVTNEGLVHPGSDTTVGTLILDGDYTQGGTGTLAIVLAGLDANDVSQLLVTGHADLAGTLDLTLLDGFTPSYGDSFDILTFDSLSGQFDEVLGADLGGLYFDLVEQADRLTLETLASPGNMNLDGQIDFDDINPFMLALNDPAAYEDQYGISPDTLGDINGDGQLDFDDINPFVALLSGDGTTVVPEPTSLALVGLGGLAMLRRRRRVV